MRHPLPAALALVLLIATACGDGIDEGANEGRGNRGTIDGVVLHPPESVAVTDPPGTEPTATDPAPTDPTDPAPPDRSAADFGWEEVDEGIDEGSLDVPRDWSDPDGETITLYVVRHRAVDPDARIGSLLVNPGGPGFGGSGLAFSADAIYGQELLDRFDIIGFDPRGTGASAPHVDCVDQYDHFFAIDSSPDSAEERTLLVDRAEEFSAACRRTSGDLLPFVSTEDSARDMDAIREALGEDTISYFGFSYGSELGATWATMFPDTVRAAVLDGAVDPTVDYLEQNLQQAAGFEAALTTFLAQCSAATACAFNSNGDAEGAFDRLAASVDAEPVPVDAPRRPAVTQGVLMTAVSQAMYDRAYWPQLEQALDDLRRGDGDGILDLYDQYYGYFGGSWDDGLEAYFAYNCHDDPGSTDPDELFTHEAEFARAAPRLGRHWLAELTFCAVWSEPPATPVTITGDGAGPIVVVGTTGDAATPLDGTRNMAAALEDGHLVVVAADQHTGYGVNKCVVDTVDGYLVDPNRPLPAETSCT